MATQDGNPGGRNPDRPGGGNFKGYGQNRSAYHIQRRAAVGQITKPGRACWDCGSPDHSRPECKANAQKKEEFDRKVKAQIKLNQSKDETAENSKPGKGPKVSFDKSGGATLVAQNQSDQMQGMITTSRAAL